MAQRVILLTIIAAFWATAVAARQDYDFEPLPVEVDGAPLWTPIAIANDGSVLVWTPFSPSRLRFSIYKSGRLEPLEPGPASSFELPIWTVTDINAKHDVTGNNWSFRAPYSGYVGWGVIRDHRDALVRIDSSPGVSTRLTGINDSGTAVGEEIVACPVDLCGECAIEWCSPPVITTAIVVVDGASVPLPLPAVRPFEDSGAIAIDDSGRILLWRARLGNPAT